MNKLIIISGDLAAGKSTLAIALSKELSIPCLIKDDMKEIACDYIGFSNREENRKISAASVAEMIYCFNQMALVDNDIILEANFRQEEIDQILSIAEENGYTVYPFELEGNIDLLYDRFLKRLPDRHPAHKTQHLEESKEKFMDVIYEFRNNIEKYGFIHINIDNVTTAQLVNNIKSIIR